VIGIGRFFAAFLGLVLTIAVASAQVPGGMSPFQTSTGGGGILNPPSAGQGMGAVSNLFIANKGQWDDYVLFRGTFPNMYVWMTRDGLVVDYFKRDDSGGEPMRVGHVVGLRFAGASQNARGAGAGRSPVHVDFFSGSHHPRNARGAGAYQEAYLRDLYQGIDMRLYRYAGRPRWDLIVRPGVDPGQIAIDVVGAPARVLPGGDLQFDTVLGPLKQRGLFAYQVVDGQRRRVDAGFVMGPDNRIRIGLGQYDRSRPLIIDPIVYGSYVGGDGEWDEATSVVSNNTDTVFVVGNTLNPEFPVTAGPYGVNWKDSLDGFIFTLQGDAYAVDYVAFISGVGEDDMRWVQMDQYGSVWVAGNSDSIWFPNDLNQFLTRDGLPVRGGSWFIRSLDFQTLLMQFDATAALVDAELTAAFDPPGPPPGWDVQGGPFGVFAPTDPPVHVRAFGPLNPLRPTTRVNTYVLNAADPMNVEILMPPTEVGVPAVSFPPPPNWGFTPSGGTFQLRYGAETTGLIPWDATAGEVEVALEALAALGPADVTCTGGPLPDSPITVSFGGAVTTPLAMTILTGELESGTIVALNGRNRGFAVRFAADPITVLDPITVPVTRALSSTTGGTISGFAIRPAPTPAGLVQLTFAGSGTTGEVPGPAGAGGFFASFDYVHGTADIPRTFTSEVIPATTFNPTRSGYLGGTGPRTVVDVAVDAEGSIYLAGTVHSGINRTLGPASTYFRTTPGIFPGGDLLRRDDLFVRKYSTDGALRYSGVIGGSGHDRADALAIDLQGNLYVLGLAQSFNFPRTRGVFGEIFTSAANAVVTKISANGAQIIYSTNLRTTVAFDPNAIAVDSRGNAYIGGTVGWIAIAGGLPTVPGSAPLRDALDGVFGAGDRIFPGTNPPPWSTTEGWFGVLNATATDLLYASYIGNNANELVYDVVVDRTDSAWVVGYTGASTVRYDAGDGIGFGNGGLEAFPIGVPPALLTPLAFKSNADLPGDGFIQKYRIALPILDSLTLSPTQLAGGLGVFSTGTVTLRNPAPAGGAIVTVRVLNPAVARLESPGGLTSQRIVFAEGEISRTFQVFTNRALAPTHVDVRAELDADFLLARLNVRPWLSAFTLATDTVAGGNSFLGTVSLFQPAPPGGVNVQLSTDNAALVSFPTPNITIPEGQASINFDIDTEGVAANTTVAVTATVEGVGSTQSVMLTPATILDLTFNPVRVNGGESAIGTIRLDGKAVASTMIRLTTNPVGPRLRAIAPSRPASPHPPGAFGLMPGAGATSAYFQIDTDAVVGTNTAITVTAVANASTVQGTLLVDANNIVAVTINAPLVGGVKSVGGGTVVSGTVSLVAPASPSGFRVPLHNSNPAAGRVSPTTVLIPPGATSASFTITTNVVTTTQMMTIRANKPGYATPSDTLQVRALNFSLTIVPSTVVGGLQNATGTIRLLGGEVAPAGGITVQLTSAQPAVVSVPASVVLPQGGTQVTFPVTTSAVGSDRTVRVSAVFPGGATSFVDMRILAPGVVSVSVSPSTFTGGATASGTVVLNRAAPAGGLVVTLSSNNPVLSVPSSVTVTAGQTVASFPVTSTPVTRDQTVTVTARRGTSAASTTVTVRANQFVSLTFRPSVIRGGQSTVGTVTIDQPAPPGGLRANISVVSPAGFTGATPPASVTIPAGARSATFTVRTRQVSRAIDVVIRVTAAGGRAVQGTFRINPNPNP
jgi:hypothetical protein